MQYKKEKIAALAPRDIKALSSILHFYACYLGDFAVSSALYRQQIAEVQLLSAKLHLLTSAKVAVLNCHEIEHIDNAISIFIAQVRQKIPPSKSRDEVVTSCEGLRMHITTTFASKQT